MKDDAIEAGFRMALETNAELLGRVPIFDGLSQARLAAIANRGKKSFFSEGAAIFKAGDKGDSAYLILTGLAATDPDPETGLEPDMLEPGTLVGELAMLVETTHRLTVRAKVRVRALAIPRADLYELMEADPSIAHHFSEKLAKRLSLLAADLRALESHFATIENSADELLAQAV
jgi:CRP-like cAMP-binding protein